MRSNSVDDLKATCRARFGAVATNERVSAYAQGVGPLPIPGIALGKTKRGRSYALAVFAQPGAQDLDKIVRMAAGEAVVHTMAPAVPRVTREWTRKRHEVIHSGVQIRLKGAPFVGTSGIIVRAAANPNVYLAITDRHVTGTRSRRGDVMTQGGRDIAVVYGTAGPDFDVPQPFDAASLALFSGTKMWPSFEHGIDEDVRSIRSATADDIGRPFCNTGQTEGTLTGVLIAIEIDGQPVAYDEGIAYLENQHAYSKPGGGNFSVAGHSGATTVCMDDFAAVGKAVAGGPNGNGDDITFADDLPGAIMATGGIAEVIT